MTAPAKCPDCDSYLGAELTRCICGWTRPGAARAPFASDKPVVHCATVGCEQRAFSRVGNRNLCQACADRLRHEEAEAFCRAQGLDTIEKKRAFCAKLARTFGRSSVGGFERWANTITQAGVDRLVLMGGKDDLRVLERLRGFGAIDGRNCVIPPGEPRRIAADAVRAERARQIAKVQEDLQRLAEKFPQPEAEAKA